MTIVLRVTALDLRRVGAPARMECSLALDLA